jgi:hypothetical protein
MACDISKGRLVPCKATGGLKAIFFINYDSTFYSDLEINGTTEEITGFSDTDYSLYQYDLRGANTMDETNEVSGDNSAAFWSGSGTLQLSSQDAVTRKEMKLMAYGRPIVITLGWDGVYKLYGAQNGCDVSAGTASGAGMGDFNGYNLTITCMEKEPAFIVDSAIIDDGLNSTIYAGV